jgi:hypothetical protein
VCKACVRRVLSLLFKLPGRTGCEVVPAGVGAPEGSDAHGRAHARLARVPAGVLAWYSKPGAPATAAVGGGGGSVVVLEASEGGCRGAGCSARQCEGPRAGLPTRCPNLPSYTPRPSCTSPSPAALSPIRFPTQQGVSRIETLVTLLSWLLEVKEAAG